MAQSQVRVGSSLSEPWFDSGIAQGRVLYPLLFNLLVNGLAAAVRRSAPGAQFSPSGVRFPCQLYADDVVLPADSVLDLQTALDAVSEWGRKWRFTFGISPTKSAVMIFGPRSRVPSCAVTLAGSLLPVVNEYTYLGVVLTPSLTWLPHVRHLISRGNRLFAQCVAWCCSGRLSVHFAAFLFRSYVLPSISRGLEFCLNSSPAVRLIDGALRRWGRHLLGWPSGSPNAAVFLERGWPHAQHLCTERLLSSACAHLPHCPLRPWFMGVPLRRPLQLIGCSTPQFVRHWLSFFCSLCPSLVSDTRRAAASSLSVCHVHCPFAVNAGPHQIVYGRSCSSSLARFWGFARWGVCRKRMILKC